VCYYNIQLISGYYGSLSTDIINCLEKQTIQALYEQDQKSKIRPLHILYRSIRSKVASFLYIYYVVSKILMNIFKTRYTYIVKACRSHKA
jgi:hypothetical protein